VPQNVSVILILNLDLCHDLTYCFYLILGTHLALSETMIVLIRHALHVEWMIQVLPITGRRSLVS